MSTPRLIEGIVSIPVAGHSLTAYRAMPRADQPLPVLLVVQEIFGLHPHIQAVCRRLASLGYLAVAPSLQERQGDVASQPDLAGIYAIVARVPDHQVLADLDACVAWAGSECNGEISRLGITGFCWGGRITWLYAAHNPQLRAGVAWYGRLDSPPTALQPMVPTALAGQLQAPVLGLYGGQDEIIPLASIERMQQALEQAGSPSRIVVYPDAPHGFHADYRDTYRPAAAADGWGRMRDWFTAHGV
ncbi:MULTISPECIES: dienelactone hydrolase family protein [Synechococcales]|uniref:dienelactone hydrolase family protein n=1 Tax=Synechococcus sp. CS-1325 TaxID=2847979 RepID=UPI00223A8F02|nr:dienelactone hydrolase family protein [Synechococcus sp. CS-1325]